MSCFLSPLLSRRLHLFAHRHDTAGRALEAAAKRIIAYDAARYLLVKLDTTGKTRRKEVVHLHRKQDQQAGKSGIGGGKKEDCNGRGGGEGEGRGRRRRW